MTNKLKELTKDELLIERERVINAISSSASPFLKRDYSKYLDKINKLLKRM